MISNGVVSGGPVLPISPHLSFGQYVIQSLRKFYGDKVALINGDTDQQMTFAELLNKIVAVATGLKSIGVKKGDVVAICSENCSEYIAVTVAASCVGATVTSFNVKYTKDEMSHTMNISKPRIIACSENALKDLLPTFQEASHIEHIIQMNGKPVSADVLMLNNLEITGDVHTFQPEEVDTINDTAFIFYSSGTTGLPKGVALTHRGSVHASAAYNYQNKNKSRLLTVTRWYHVYGILTTIQYACCGHLVVYLSQLKPETYLRAIEKYKINEILAVPTIVVILAKSPLVTKYDLSSVAYVWCAAAPLGADTINQAMKNLPCCKGIYQSYGLTETSLTVVQEPIISNSGKYGSCGLPMAGIEAKVVDLNTRENLGPNQEGEVCLRGPTSMKGYVGNEAATRAMFDDEGFIISGDIGYYDEDGWIYIVDRIKEMIKFKGQQVAPALVETVILSHDSVAECGVVGAPDELAGELPTAFVVAKSGSGLTEDELLQYTAARINEILAVPTIVVILAKSPLVTKYDLSSVAYVWCAAAPLGADTINQAMKNLPCCKGIYQSYGLTETSLTVVQEPIISNSGKYGSCGLPMAGIEAKVVDLNTRKNLGPNQEAEVCLRGPTSMKGYVGNEAATRAMFDDEGFIISGDIGYYDEDGWIYIVDRIKEMIKYKGQQVAPALVEAVILSHDSVAECGVVGAPDELAGELPTAFVVAKSGSGLTEDELLQYTAARLSPASRLRGGVIFIQSIPRNGSGKILRRELRKMLQTKKSSFEN